MRDDKYVLVFVSVRVYKGQQPPSNISYPLGVAHHMRLIAERGHIETAVESLINLPNQRWELSPRGFGVSGVAVDKEHQVGLAGVIVLPDPRPILINFDFTLDHSPTPLLLSWLMLPVARRADRCFLIYMLLAM